MFHVQWLPHMSLPDIRHAKRGTHKSTDSTSTAMAKLREFPFLVQTANHFPNTHVHASIKATPRASVRLKEKKETFVVWGKV
jgi:hypothetical protein